MRNKKVNMVCEGLYHLHFLFPFDSPQPLSSTCSMNAIRGGGEAVPLAPIFATYTRLIFLVISCRDFYHIFSYFLVFLNVLVGMLSCVIRILTGLFVGVFLLCRIDRPILMRGYEHLDQCEFEEPV